MSRMADLEARRLALLARCEAQRAEISQRMLQLRENPGSLLRGGAEGGGGWGVASILRRTRHPIAWVAALAGITLIGKTREVLTALVWARSALSLLARVTEVVGLATALRRTRSRVQGDA
jgi:hypothetical protein